MAPSPLHLHVAALEGVFAEMGLFHRSLHIHAVIDNVGNELRVGLRLVPATHDAEAYIDVAPMVER